MTLLELHGVTKVVRLPDNSPLEILRGVDLVVDAGEHVSIVGRSGAGKSTLLAILGLLDTPTTGDYLLDGVSQHNLSAGARARLRGLDFGFVFQEYNLMRGRTALDNVIAPLLYARGYQFWHRAELAEEMLNAVGLGGRLEVPAQRLSGGEQQRVAIARALVRRPRVVLADEPTGSLDVDTGEELLILLDQITEECGCSLVTITHDLAVASRANRHFRLAEGVLTPISINSRSAGFLGALPGGPKRVSIAQLQADADRTARLRRIRAEAAVAAEAGTNADIAANPPAGPDTPADAAERAARATLGGGLSAAGPETGTQTSGAPS